MPSRPQHARGAAASAPRRKGLVLMVLGLACLVAAAALSGSYTWEGYQMGRASARALEQIEQLTPEDAQEAPVGQMPFYTIDGINYLGRIQIPSVEIDLPVIANYSMEALDTAPARYTGSYLTNDMVICAHRSSWQFGPIRTMQPGDEVLLLTADDKVLRYQAAAIETVGGTEIDRMVHSEYDLSLFCCTLDSVSRVTVRCMRVYD